MDQPRRARDNKARLSLGGYMKIKVSRAHGATPNKACVSDGAEERSVKQSYMRDFLAPFIKAIDAGDLDAARELVAKLGAREERLVQANGLFHHCAACDRGEAIDLLARSGIVAGIDAACEASDSTPLYLACVNGNAKAFRALIEHGADPAKADSDGSTPLMAVCALGHAQFIRPLVFGGAPVDALDRSGVSALMMACRRSRHGCALELLAFGANPEVRSPKGFNAFDYARQDGRADFAEELLLRWNALCEAKTLARDTPSAQAGQVRLRI